MNRSTFQLLTETNAKDIDPTGGYVVVAVVAFVPGSVASAEQAALVRRHRRLSCCMQHQHLALVKAKDLRLPDAAPDPPGAL